MFLAFTLRYPLAWGGNAGSRDERSATLVFRGADYRLAGLGRNYRGFQTWRVRVNRAWGLVLVQVQGLQFRIGDSGPRGLDFNYLLFRALNKG